MTAFSHILIGAPMAPADGSSLLAALSLPDSATLIFIGISLALIALWCFFRMLRGLITALIVICLLCIIMRLTGYSPECALSDIRQGIERLLSK